MSTPSPGLRMVRAAKAISLVRSKMMDSRRTVKPASLIFQSDRCKFKSSTPITSMAGSTRLAMRVTSAK
ncbi:Uncharacterised protein [uncultured archaeon]|nr:Uncharacterised protein [uncultured archaeon]